MTLTRPPAADARRLRALLTRFEAPAFCHIPGDAAFDPSALAGDGDDGDRWNEPDQPTAYLAGDPLTAIAELARHADPGTPTMRTVVRVRLGPIDLLDVRRDAVCAALGRPPSEGLPGLDRDDARAMSRVARVSRVADGLIVPSMAFPDQLDRFNVVVFTERIPDGIEVRLAAPEPVGSVVLRP